MWDDQDDKHLAIELLFGRFVEAAGKVSFEYLKAGSDRERLAWAALARLLVKIKGDDPLLRLVLLHLSNLIDPDSTEPRKLVVQRRRGSKQPTPNIIEQHITLDIADAIANDIKIDSAVNQAAKRYGFSERQIRRIWAKDFARTVRSLMPLGDDTTIGRYAAARRYLSRAR